MHTVRRIVLFACLLLVLLTSSVILADDGRINPPPYHIGGDTLYCDQGEGCRLLNKEGQFLTSWSQDEIDVALGVVDQTEQPALVADRPGTYGTASLWAVPSDEGNGNRKLCLYGYDEWGKQNYFCFAVTSDGKYLPVPVAAGEAAPAIDYCSQFSLIQFVTLIANPGITGVLGAIVSITPPTLTVANIGTGAPIGLYTAPCSLFEIAL